MLIALAGARLASDRVGYSVAAVAVALALTPVRRRSQRVVDRGSSTAGAATRTRR